MLSSETRTANLPDEIVHVLEALKDKKAETVRLFDISEKSSITDYMVLATGTSPPHLRAMKDGLDKALKQHGVRTIGQERQPDSGWLVVDGFDFMVHLQTEDMRSFYGLDTLWKDGIELPVDDAGA